MDASALIERVRDSLGDRADEYLLPPLVFTSMQGEFVDFDPDENVLVTRFPVLEDWLNPYRFMQGGMVAAAVDNTLGPLSMLVAPPNVTRRLEMKYSHTITLDDAFITVRGWLIERVGRRLRFAAEVRGETGALMARARAEHWVLAES